MRYPVLFLSLALCALFLTPAPATANGGDDTTAAATQTTVDTESSSTANSKSRTTTKTTRTAPKAAPAATPAAEDDMGYNGQLGGFYVNADVIQNLNTEGEVFIRTNSHYAACVNSPKCEKCQQDHSFRKESRDQWHDLPTKLVDGRYIASYDSSKPPGNGTTLELNAVILHPDGKRTYWPSGATKSVGVDNLLKGRMVQFKLNP